MPDDDASAGNQDRGQCRIACDGGEGALGHPRVWLQIPEDTGFVECGYCDAKYVHRDFEGKV